VRCIAADPRGIDPDLLVAAGADRIVTKRAPQHVDRLAQGSPRVRLVGVRPKDSDQRIAPMEAWRTRHAQVGEQRYALGLGEQRMHVTAVGRAEFQRAEQPEIDHCLHSPRRTTPERA
jgi:hypothetical protein